MAEVLITLGVIGVVAALTLPALINKYQKVVIKNRFKKAYSLVSQAIKQVEVNNGAPLECYIWPVSRGGLGCLEYTEEGNCKQWEHSDTYVYGANSECTKFMSEFEKTVKIITIYKEKNDDASDKDVNVSTAGTAWWRKQEIAKARKAYVLSDGTILLMSGWSGMNIFAIDVNGKSKPNKWGYDIFAFSVVGDIDKSPWLAPSPQVSVVEKGGKSTKQMLQNIK